MTENKPVDLSIIAIIDSVELKGKKIFEKFKNERRPEDEKRPEES